MALQKAGTQGCRHKSQAILRILKDCFGQPVQEPDGMSALMAHQALPDRAVKCGFTINVQNSARHTLFMQPLQMSLCPRHRYL